MRQRKPRFLKPDTLIDNKHNRTRIDAGVHDASVVNTPQFFKDSQN